MTNLNEQAALSDKSATKIMGWHTFVWTDYWLNKHNIKIIKKKDWKPPRDYNQLRQLQEKVIEDGKWDDYFEALWEIVDKEFYPEDNILIAPSLVFRDAAPAQHIEAMLKAYE